MEHKACTFRLSLAVCFVCLLFPQVFAAESSVTFSGNNEEPVNSSCWDTGCLSESWSEEDGCGNYGYVELSRRPCGNGYIHTCCAAPMGGFDFENVTDDSPVNGVTGDLTYYNLGLTACGRVYTDQDMVVALAFAHFTTPNPNVDPICGRKIQITDPQSQKQIIVEVQDKCAGCKWEDVDVSPAAFQQLRPLGVGRFKVTWDFI